MARLLKWRRCTILTSTESVFLSTAGLWSQQLAAQSIEAWPFQTFEPGAFDSKALMAIQKTSLRVVLALAYSADTVKIALSAFNLSMISKGWAWFGTEDVAGAENAVDASIRDRAKRALFGWLFILPAQTQSAAMNTFYDEVKEYGQQQFNLSISSVSSSAVQTYDAIFMYAHAATQVLAAGGKPNDGAALVKAMRNISFQGIQQRVVLDENGDAVQPFSIMNYVEVKNTMQVVDVGSYVSGQLNLEVEEIQWPGNGTEIPVDTAGLLFFFCLAPCKSPQMVHCV